MKRHAVIVALAAPANHTDTGIANFLNVSRFFVNKVRRELECSNGDSSFVSERKKHSRRSDTVRSCEFVEELEEIIDADPTKSMREIARKINVSESTIRRAVHDDLRYKSYVMRRDQFLFAKNRENRVIRSKRLLNKLKHPEEPNMLWFFSNEKNFDLDQKVNRRNDRWLCSDPQEVPTAMHTKFPSNVMVLGVISNERHVMPPHFFEQGHRVNAAAYIDILASVVLPWIESVAQGRPYVFQQDSAPAHTAHTTQEWLSDHFHDHVTPNMWPPSSPDLNPMDFYVWGVVERQTNRHPHPNRDLLKSAISQEMKHMFQEHVIRACSRFRGRLEAVIEAEGGFIE